jgi:hypothetical protein
MNRRQLRFQNFEDIVRDAEQLLATGYTRLGNWSLGQMCDHLARIFEHSLDGFPKMLPAPVRWIIRWLKWKQIMRHEPMSQRISAPGYLMPPDAVDDRAGIDRLKAAVARLKGNTGPMHPSPAFGKLTNDEWREVHLWHSEHHLSYLQPRSTAG